MAEYQKEPFGEVRADIQSAMVAKVIADVNRGKNPPYELRDFMLFSEKKKGMDAASFKKAMSHLVKKDG
jgi:hypothetical protein